MLLLPVMTGSLNATLIEYSDRASWEAATPGFANIDFDITSTYQSFNTAAGVTLDENGIAPIGVQFVGLATPGSYELTVVDPAFSSAHDHGSGDVLKGPRFLSAEPTRSIEMILPLGINSFGFDLMTYDSLEQQPAGPQTFTVSVDGTEVTQVVTLLQPGRAFFGVVSDTEVGQIELVLDTGISGRTFPMIDNFSSGSVTATPEAHTYLLVGSGLLLVALLRRRVIRRGQ
ncbi:MAG: hypothetical protein GY953_31165 [bacterium]|nr:hypothetical protein [bacterium]